MAQKWILAIKAYDLNDALNENKLSRSYRKVCKNHFRECDFKPNIDGKSQLVHNSIPSVSLPPDDAVSKSTFKPSKPVKRLQHQNRPNVHVRSIVGTSNPEARKPLEEARNTDDEWMEVDLENERDIHLSINDILQNETKRSYRELMSTEKKLLRSIRYLKKRNKDLLQRKKIKINDKVVMNYLGKKLNESQCQFIQMQLTNNGRTKHGRRYTDKQKSLSLAFYKQGPKLYRFLETMFVLPTKRTVGRHSANMLFKSGLDHKMLDAIKNAVKNWPEKDKYCSVSWDEVSVNEHLDYNSSQDFIEGFVELAGTRKPSFATHSLTFMARGINKSFKQTFGYFFTSALFAIELVELVKLMVGALSTTGLNPILSLCDQVYTNSNTVNLLISPKGKTSQNQGQLLKYYVNGRQIIHVYDPSHLIKTVRNNLQTKDIVHTIVRQWCNSGLNVTNVQSVKQTASWDHISDLYKIDTESTERLLPKLTDEHLAPNKYKMKVSLATQVFSKTCGTVMLDCIEEEILPEHFGGTAQILLFMNDIFDSFNGSEDYKGETPLKSAVRANSIHFSFWEYALSMLSQMNFVNKVDRKINNRSSVLKKVESTIRGFIAISKICFELDIPKVSLRDTSQDGLENYFGCVKCCNQTRKPTPRGFRTGYATMTINNITGTNSLRSNCERDSSTSILSNIHEFILDNDKGFVDRDTDDLIDFDPMYESELV